MQQPDNTNLEQVVTRRSVGFYLGICLLIFFMGGIAALLFALAADAGSWVPALFGVLPLILAPYLIVVSYRTTPIVRMSLVGVKYKRQHYAWEDVHSVKLTGSQTVKMAGAMEGTRIVLKGGGEIILLMASYSNLAEVRWFLVNTVPLQKYMSNGEQGVGSTVLAVVESSVNEVQWFKGNSVLNTNGSMTCFLLLLAVVPIVLVGFVDVFVFISAMLVGLAAGLSMYVNYFGVSGQHIEVRNIFRPWKRKKYFLTDIRQVIFAYQNRVNVIRFVFNDFSTKQIFAGGLRDRDWFALLGLLRLRGVEVVDEMNYTERMKW